MQTCFEILGLTSSATKKELKRAYFSQVRLHPPEKDPEAFKKIRVAYEEATAALEMDLPVFATPDNPKEKELQRNIEIKLNAGDTGDAFSLIKTGVKRYPENQFFLYHQCRLMRERNTNAINIAEKLLKLSPDNRHYNMELALCYIKQGWDKRALSIGNKLIQGGVRNTYFIKEYINFLKIRNDYEKIYALLYKLISENECQNDKYLTELTELATLLISVSVTLEDPERQEAASRALIDFVQNNLNLLGESPIARICEKLRIILTEAKPDQRDFIRNTMMELQSFTKDKKETQKVNSIIGSSKLEGIRKDKRLPKCVEILYRAYVMTPSYHPNAVKMDARLCGIMEREKLLACRDILKKEYPDFHNKIVTFIRAISTDAKAQKLKKELLEKYEDYSDSYFPDRKRYFYELYPDEKPEWLDDDDDDDMDDDLRDLFDIDELLRRLFGSRFR